MMFNLEFSKYMCVQVQAAGEYNEYISGLYTTMAQVLKVELQYSTLWFEPVTYKLEQSLLRRFLS